MDGQGQFIRTSPRFSLPWIAGGIAAAILIASASYFFLAKKEAKTTVSTGPTTSAPTPNPTLIEKQKKGEEVSVFLTPSGFIPSDMTIKAGANVTWTNQSGVAGNVSIVGNFGPGASVSKTFDTPGTYSYQNRLNSSQTASITVQ